MSTWTACRSYADVSRSTVATTSEADAPVDSSSSPTRSARSTTARAWARSTASPLLPRPTAHTGGVVERTALAARSRRARVRTGCGRAGRGDRDGLDTRQAWRRCPVCSNPTTAGGDTWGPEGAVPAPGPPRPGRVAPPPGRVAPSPDTGTVARWVRERTATQAREPCPPDHRRVPGLRRRRAGLPRTEVDPARAEVADGHAARRAAVSAAFPGERLVVPAGGLKVRSNDTDYVFRPHSAFAHLTGLGSDREPDAVLVLEPARATAEAGPRGGPLLPPAGRPRHRGVLRRLPLRRVLGRRPAHPGRHRGRARPRPPGTSTSSPTPSARTPARSVVRVVRDADPDVTARARRGSRAVGERGADEADEPRRPQREADERARRTFLSTLRLVKDEWEIEQMRDAVAATHQRLRRRHRRPARGASVAAAASAGSRASSGCTPATRATASATTRSAPRGDHANTLHWIKNTGDVSDGDLLLLDAGVEVDSLFTADITRTLPVSGDVHRRPAQDLRRGATPPRRPASPPCRPGNTFCDVHDAAIRVIAEHLHEWGLLPEGVDVEAHARPGARPVPPPLDGARHEPPPRASTSTTAPSRPARSTWTPSSKPGMVLTVEPGLYFKADDELVPGGAPRHRRADRGRRARHRRRLREPLGRDAARAPTRSRRGSPASGTAWCPRRGDRSPRTTSAPAAGSSRADGCAQKGSAQAVRAGPPPGIWARISRACAANLCSTSTS